MAKANKRILENTRKEVVALKDAYNKAQNHPDLEASKEVIKRRAKTLAPIVERAFNTSLGSNKNPSLNDIHVAWAQPLWALAKNETARDEAYDHFCQGREKTVMRIAAKAGNRGVKMTRGSKTAYKRFMAGKPFDKIKVKDLSVDS